MLNGLVETYQPDFLVQTKVEQAALFWIEFPEKRLITIDDLMARSIWEQYT
jgi:hypothetical protein